MDANQRQRLITERFEKSYEMKDEKKRLIAKLATLEKQNDEAQNTIREMDTSREELERLPDDLLLKPADERNRQNAERMNQCYRLKEESDVLRGNIRALKAEFDNIRDSRIPLLEASIDEIQKIPEHFFAAPASPASPRGRGRPRRSGGSTKNAPEIPRDRLRLSHDSDDYAPALPQDSSYPHEDEDQGSGIAALAKKPRHSRQSVMDEVTRPGLCDWHNDLSTFRTLGEEDHVESDRGGGFAMFSKDHPTIVKLNGRWAEIWCKFCGINTSRVSQLLLLGMAGLHSHVRRSRCHLQVKNCTLEEVAKTCGRHYLSDEELDDMRKGKKQVRGRWDGMQQEYV